MCLVSVKLSDRVKRAVPVSCHLSARGVPNAVREVVSPTAHGASGLDCDCHTALPSTRKVALGPGEGRMTRFQNAEESKTVFSTLILQKVTETPSKGVITESLLSDYVRYTRSFRLNTSLVEEGHCLHFTDKEKCVLLSRVQLFATPWTVARQAPPGIFQERRLEWVAMPFSRGSF